MMSYEKVATAALTGMVGVAISFMVWSWKKEAERYKGIVEEKEKYIKFLDIEIERSEFERKRSEDAYNSMKILHDSLVGDMKSKSNVGTDIGKAD